ncbi:MAG: hypothetical protein Q9225_001882 [Loekoesia sp. 1 TL-2023]
MRARQPGKAVWTTLFILSGPLRLIYLLLYFVPNRFRQHPQWTYRQAVGNALLKLWFSFASTVEYRTTKSLEPGTEKERFVVMDPKQPESCSGVASDKMIKPISVDGMWYPRLYNPDVDGSRVIVLHFHGGAYVLGGVRPAESGWGADVLARATDGLVLFPQYRLSSQFKGRFPAALQDSITSYQYLLRLGVPSSRIVISGDSAGGNLALALLRYIGEESSLPRRKAVASHRNQRTDYITPAFVNWGLRTYRPSFLEGNYPYLSPLNNCFATKVPIFMQHGTAEVLFDEQKTFCSQMKQINGNKIERLEVPNAPHDTFLAGQVLGWEKEAEDAARKACDFLNRQRKEVRAVEN